MEISKITPQAKYDKAHTTGLYLKLNKETDKDIIEKLDASGNKQGYIKQLIRSDIKKEGKYEQTQESQFN